MTVEELIEELRRQPNQRVPVQLRKWKRDVDGSKYPVRVEVDNVRFDGGAVLLEA